MPNGSLADKEMRRKKASSQSVNSLRIINFYSWGKMLSGIYIYSSAKSIPCPGGRGQVATALSLQCTWQLIWQSAEGRDGGRGGRGRRDGGREGRGGGKGREGRGGGKGREGGREGEREGGREGGREEGREGGRKRGKEGEGERERDWERGRGRGKKEKTML